MGVVGVGKTNRTGGEDAVGFRFRDHVISFHFVSFQRPQSSNSATEQPLRAEAEVYGEIGADYEKKTGI